MDTNALVVAGVAALVLLIALVWVMQRRRRVHLRRRFGPEYDRAVRTHKNLRAAELELEERQRRVARLEIHPLTTSDAHRFAESWRTVQRRFVDDPAGAVGDADRLVTEVMQARGYPLGDFERRAADISVDHPRVVANYRAAQVIAERRHRGESSTEDLRQALVHYRELFADLLETPEEPRLKAAAGGRS
jgi:hypothetical protein